ncbi:hypothetical protein [Heliorestis acidaminivorans]|uniref:hypothetical protein n=1 Tax=Heliorestis acidaminivorans TaxID=553427 RepID=UPI001479253F|nr:hypothetical protein [Heliorestis acidaminivorans]
MSLPTMPKRTREEALNVIIASIALEEKALAQLIKAEAEKVQHAVKIGSVTQED